jgi:translocation and assembly module TamB
MKRRLFIALLAVPVLFLLLAALTVYGVFNTTAGARLVIDIVRGQLPGMLDSEQPEGDFASGLLLRNVRYRDKGLSVSANHIDLAISLEFFPLSATVSRLQLQTLAVQGSGEEPTAESRSEFPSSLELPVPVTLEALEVHGFEWLDPNGVKAFEFDQLSLAAKIHETLELENGELEMEQGRFSFAGQMKLAAPFALDLNLDSKVSLEVKEDAGPLVSEFQVRLGGDLDRYELSTAGWIEPPDHERHQVQLEAGGNLEELAISEFDIEGPLFRLAAVAEMNLSAQVFRVSAVNLELIDSAAVLEGAGSFDLGRGKLLADISWKDFSWPLGAEQPELLSRLGEITVSGDFDAWKINGDIEIESPGLAPGILGFEADGNRERAEIALEEGQVLGGVITGTAGYDWSRGGLWSADILAEGISTGGFDPALSGEVNADIKAEGRLEPFQLEAVIRKLDGEIREKHISASGRLRLKDKQLEFNDMVLISAESTVILNGNTASADGLEFEANIVDLGAFVPESSGTIGAGGRVSLHADKQRLQLDLKGRDLAWKDFKLSSLSVHDAEQAADDAIVGLRVDAIEPQFNGEAFDRIRLDLNIARSFQSIHLTALKSGLELTAEVDGSLRQQDKSLAESEWAGHLNALGVTESGEKIFRLLEPAGIEISAWQASITAACLTTAADSNFCLDAGWQAGGEYHTRLEFTQLSLQKIQALLDLEMEATQFLNGSIDLTGTEALGPSGDGTIHLSPGEVRYAGESDALFETGKGEFGFTLLDGGLLAGNFNLPLPGRGEIDLGFRIEEVQSGLDADLEGRVKVDLEKLDILALFLPMVDQVDGKLDADLVLSGKVADPDFSGELSLAKGRLLHEASGFSVNDIELSGQVRDNEETQLNGSFSLQEGVGRLQAKIDLSEFLSPRFELGLEGENLPLFDVPDLKLVAEPDIHLKWQGGEIDVNGKLMIPSARIAPSIVPQSPVVESPDVVITAGELSSQASKKETKSNFAIRGDLEIALGDDVELDLAVADAKVGGSVVFSWQDALMPIANGNYELEGQILAFGQLLRITQGYIGFPGVPADNPHLNIRAERQIYGNSEIRRAGVFVAGTLSRPVIEPYTEPMTNRERAQTLLITGSDFNMERGVGAVDIGTYIAPRIFVSYGLGVFEDESVVSIRYDLGRSWGIKATSGERQTGLDISYTIER